MRRLVVVLAAAAVATVCASGRSYFPVLKASGGHPAVLVCELT